MRAALAIVLALSGAGVASAQDVASAPGAILRGLDKVSGETVDIELDSGQTAEFGRLAVTLADCRYPVEDPSSDAFAHLTIADAATGTAVFDGWMIASSPALSALDDPRYDLWVLRCKSS
ncbi:MAG: hypothetical protein B7Z02_02100 [Rhodobacterales bacterium 32-67-9]|nr:MAG: hypothetical protein B7Z02_02100 [Rhodobacterales bacterium 32-67-9]